MADNSARRDHIVVTWRLKPRHLQFLADADVPLRLANLAAEALRVADADVVPEIVTPKRRKAKR